MHPPTSTARARAAAIDRVLFGVTWRMCPSYLRLLAVATPIRATHIPAPTGPSRHADPGPPRRTTQNSGQITTFAVHPALARPALPSPRGLSTSRLAATRPPPERASAGGHRASVCVALVSLARTVPTQSTPAPTQNSLKTLTSFAQRARLSPPPSVLPVSCDSGAGETSFARGRGSVLGPRPRHGLRRPSHGDACARATRTKAPPAPPARSLRFAPAAGTATRPRPTRLWAAGTVRSWPCLATAQSARAVGRRTAAEAPRSPAFGASRSALRCLFVGPVPQVFARDAGCSAAPAIESRSPKASRGMLRPLGDLRPQVPFLADDPSPRPHCAGARPLTPPRHP